MPDLSEIKSKAIDYLARREHSRHELKQKLLQKFSGLEDSIDKALNELAAKNLQSDKRFLEIFIQHRAKQGYGLLRIKQELAQHNMDQELLQQVIDELDIDWVEMAKALYHKRYNNKPISDFKDKMKRSQYLYSHGFSQDQIKSTIP